jgi:IMP dehydrogenase
MLWQHRIKSLPIVDATGNLRYLVTRGDIANESRFPLATTDGDGRLRVLFAAETRTEIAYERLERGFAAGADGVVVDTSQGHTRFAHDMLKYIGMKYPDKVIIGGNVSTREAASAISELDYVDAFRCGQGSGSICTTAGTIGVSRAGAVGVYECAEELTRHRRDDHRLVTIADGGIREAGDIVKALAVGAGVVMLGNLLAGTEEAPGETIERDGKHVKTYRGMGSAEALKGKQQRGYARHPEGVSGAVPYRGSVHKHVPLLMDAVRHGMEVLNCASIIELHQRLYNDELRFERRTAGSLAESRPHSLST